MRVLNVASTDICSGVNVGSRCELHKPLRIRAAGFCQMISMQLYPWAVKPILNIDADPSTVHVIGLDADWQRFADDLTQIVAHRGYGEAIDCIRSMSAKLLIGISTI